LGGGTLFRINLDGTGFTNVYNFDASNRGVGGLVLGENTFYGVTYRALVKIRIDGSQFDVLHNFSNDNVWSPGGLILLGNSLYGIAGGGSLTNGIIFKVNIDGTGFKNLYNFTGGLTGGNPCPGLVFSDNKLYGTTRSGGATDMGSDGGTLYSLLLQPEVEAISSGSNLIFYWPTNFTGFTLQSTTNLTSLIWTTNLPAPVVVNGQYTVTNAISGSQQFFRLSQ